MDEVPGVAHYKVTPSYALSLTDFFLSYSHLSLFLSLTYLFDLSPLSIAFTRSSLLSLFPISLSLPGSLSLSVSLRLTSLLSLHTGRWLCDVIAGHSAHSRLSDHFGRCGRGDGNGSVRKRKRHLLHSHRYR